METQRCQYKGCEKLGDKYEFRIGRKGGYRWTERFYCREHASEHGFCRACGDHFEDVVEGYFSADGLCEFCQEETDVLSEAEEDFNDKFGFPIFEDEDDTK